MNINAFSLLLSKLLLAIDGIRSKTPWRGPSRAAILFHLSLIVVHPQDFNQSFIDIEAFWVFQGAAILNTPKQKKNYIAYSYIII